jgi:Holliday junction resolvasome RuvABC endonuclease subunit
MHVPTPLLSLDPSSTKVGWAMLGPGPSYINSNVALTWGMNADDRIITVGDIVAGLINQWRPAAVLIEVPDYIADRANARNLINYFMAVGVAIHTASRFAIPLIRERASRIKESNVKQQHMERFRQLVHRPPLTDDEADAFCMGWDLILKSMAPPLAATSFPPL